MTETPVGEGPTSLTAVFSAADLSISTSEVTAYSLRFPAGRRIPRSHSGGSLRERYVRVAVRDIVREWISRPNEKNGMDSPSGKNTIRVLM